MKRALLATLVVACGCRAEDPKPSAPSGPRLSFVRAADGDVATVVARELAQADGKRVVVYVGATWCEPCKRFHDSAAAGQLDAVLPPIRFVEFDLDRDQERLKSAGYSSKYIPLFAVPLPDGRASGRQIAGSIKGPGAPSEIAPRLVDLLK